MKRLLVLTLILCCSATGRAAEWLTPQDLATWMMDGRDALVVDVRSTSEAGRGRIEGSVNWPVQTLRHRTLPQGVTIVLVDDDLSARRARQAADACETGGAEDIRLLAGGYTAWRRAGHPVAARAGLTTGRTASAVTVGDLRDALAGEKAGADRVPPFQVIELRSDESSAIPPVIPKARVLASGQLASFREAAAKSPPSGEVLVFADEGDGQATRWAQACIARGLDARVLAGGTAAWKLNEKPETPPEGPKEEARQSGPGDRQPG